jgi:hypothetical protein
MPVKHSRLPAIRATMPSPLRLHCMAVIESQVQGIQQTRLGSYARSSLAKSKQLLVKSSKHTASIATSRPLTPMATCKPTLLTLRGLTGSVPRCHRSHG